MNGLSRSCAECDDTDPFHPFQKNPLTATLDDCARITELLGLPPDAHVIGFLELLGTHDLAVDAVYTVEGRNQNNTDVDVERAEGKFVSH